MIPILYRPDEFFFLSNGLGRLTECSECTVTQERNGIFECEFKYPITGRFYDTMINPLDEASVTRYREVKSSYASLPPYKTEPRWYDDIRYDFTLGATDKSLKKTREEITADYLAAYLANAETAPACDPAVKKAKTKAYVDGLFANGGPAVNQFRKLFGEEKSREIFEEIVFSCR